MAEIFHMAFTGISHAFHRVAPSSELTATIAPLKNSNFEIVLFSFRTLKTALRKQRYLCQKFPLPIPFHTWKISCFEHISHACLFTCVSFGTLSVLNS